VDCRHGRRDCDAPHGLKPSGFLGHARPNGPRYAPMAASQPRNSFSLMHGSVFACGPSPHNGQTEVVEEPHWACAEAILLLTLGTPSRIAGRVYSHRQARTTPSPPCPQSLKGHSLRRASPGQRICTPRHTCMSVRAIPRVRRAATRQWSECAGRRTDKICAGGLARLEPQIAPAMGIGLRPRSLVAKMIVGPDSPRA